jgi:hypothetical protein
LIEAYRQAGFHAVQLPGDLPQDEFLLVTKHYCCADNDVAFIDAAFADAVRSILVSHGGEPCCLTDGLDDDEIDYFRARAPHALN